MVDLYLTIRMKNHPYPNSHPAAKYRAYDILYNDIMQSFVVFLTDIIQKHVTINCFGIIARRKIDLKPAVATKLTETTSLIKYFEQVT